MDGAFASLAPTPPPETRIESEERPPEIARPTPSIGERIVALFEVLLCSDYPTQLAVGATFVVFGFHPQQADGRLNISYVVALSLVDTFLLLTLILLFLKVHGDRPRNIFLGGRPVWREVRAGAIS